MNRRWPLSVAWLVVVAVVMLAACGPGASPSGPEQRNVFAPRGYNDSGPSTTGNELDVGIPQLYNSSDQVVRIRSARFRSVSPAVVTLSVTAYSDTHGSTEIASGNYLKMPCRRYYRPYPVTDDVTPPHSAGDWYILIGFRITKPGTYHIWRVRITYTTGSHLYWQDVSIGLTAYVKKGKALPPSC